MTIRSLILPVLRLWWSINYWYAWNVSATRGFVVALKKVGSDGGWDWTLGADRRLKGGVVVKDYGSVVVGGLTGQNADSVFQHLVDHFPVGTICCFVDGQDLGAEAIANIPGNEKLVDITPAHKAKAFMA